MPPGIMADKQFSKDKKFLKSYKVNELVVIAMMASLGIAVKPFVVSLAHIVTGPLFIPGGSLAGGLYMMWLVLGAFLVKRKGTATIIGIVQGIIVLVIGAFGSHGIFSFITYSLPGLAVDGVFLLTGQLKDRRIFAFLAGIAANVTGVILSNILFFRLPLIPFVLSVSLGALSGAVGGLLAYKVGQALERLKI